MSSPVLGTKAKKSPTATDSHHLFDALAKGKIHLTRFILAAANSQLHNSWDKDGRTPLIACCDVKEEGTRDQMVQILLEHGANVNMTDREGRSALIHACEKRCNDIVRLLIHHHHIKPDLEDVYGNTALIYSAAVGNDVATELLTRNFRRLGLHVDHYNKQGNTALHVATKNGNMNCAKILTQKGRANVYLKDREGELTAMEWCLDQGYSKEEVDFLKPNSRFYRVAKLATTLSRSRSTLSTSSSDSKVAVTSSKSIDSAMGNGNKAFRGKVTLSRSKSQTVESTRQSEGGTTIFRQATLDVPTSTANQLRVGPNENTSKAADVSSFSLLSGLKLKDRKPRSKEDKKDKGKGLKKLGSTSAKDAIPEHEVTRSVSKADLEDCMNVSSVKMTRKGPSVVESPEETINYPNRSGRLTGLGCSLSVTSMASVTTSVGTVDSSRPSSSMDEDSSLSSDITYVSELAGDHGVSLVKSCHTFGSNMGEEVALISTSASPCSDVVALSDLQSSESSVTSRSTMASLATLDQGRGAGKEDGDLVCTSASPCSDESDGRSVSSRTTMASTVTLDPSGRSVSSRAPVAAASTHAVNSSSSSARQQKDGNGNGNENNDDNNNAGEETGDQYSDAGHNVLSLVKNSAEYKLQNPPTGHDQRMSSHVCSGQQISQDA